MTSLNWLLVWLWLLNFLHSSVLCSYSLQASNVLKNGPPKIVCLSFGIFCLQSKVDKHSLSLWCLIGTISVVSIHIPNTFFTYAVKVNVFNRLIRSHNPFALKSFILDLDINSNFLVTRKDLHCETTQPHWVCNRISLFFFSILETELPQL